ncbi:haloacid dehalogenase type II [Rhizobiales bacterium]|uniref:haloacid dehalogenase type II n=1 Tax=Hongsoonwoonella zoysiae TaxID=2821844 RepID=UPI001560382F|nr:haloacid dehalogenase type II [Hongsoonwoonella zoysiae]NRG19631.1 haloacid dehalogenase type II [Hongsoonwoonella zoysiae]
MTIKAIVFDAYGTLYDVQSVSSITEEKFPGKGELITQVWRLKQLEYTWLRSQMGAFHDFWAVSQESLAYTLDCIGIPYEKTVFEEIMAKYRHLDPYADSISALEALKGRQRAILSNGSQDMLDDLIRNTGLNAHLEACISVDAVQIFKPNNKAYELIEEKLGVKPEEVLFVSSNAFDACGAKNFGLKVAWIERVTAEALRAEIAGLDKVGPTTMFKILRMRMEHFGMDPDYRLSSLNELAGIVAS